MKYTLSDIQDYELEINEGYPDFCDSYITWAIDHNNKELTDDELYLFNQYLYDSGLLYELCFNNYF